MFGNITLKHFSRIEFLRVELYVAKYKLTHFYELKKWMKHKEMDHHISVSCYIMKFIVLELFEFCSLNCIKFGDFFFSADEFKFF